MQKLLDIKKYCSIFATALRAKQYFLTFKTFKIMKKFAVIKTFDCLNANYVKGTFDNIRDAEEFIELLKKTEYQSKHINYNIYTLNK